MCTLALPALQILVTQGSLNRRTRFIMGCSLALGVGVELVPQWGEWQRCHACHGTSVADLHFHSTLTLSQSLRQTASKHDGDRQRCWQPDCDGTHHYYLPVCSQTRAD
jgi:hypothetical protein